MMRKSTARIILAATLILAPTLRAPAHSIGVMLNKTSAKPGSKATVYLSWGHALPVDELIDGKDLEGYQVHAPSGSTTPLKVEGRSLQANEVTLDQEGIYQFSAARRPSVFSVVKGSDGKTSFLRLPKSEVTLEPGSRIETSARSQMFAKAIAVVGEGGDRVPPKLGHTLEIVPLTGAGKLRLDETARFRVLFRDRPLAGVKVFATCVATNPDGTPTATLGTDAEGVVELTPADAGMWVLGVGHSLPAAGDVASQYDKESFWASLTIGVAAGEKE
jgi:uncharacterized GH25 family protein